MATPEEQKDVMRRYIDMLTKTDVAGMVALFAEEGSMEDPVGAPIHRGRAALEAFYGAAAPALTVEIVGPICATNANEVAAPILARLDMGDNGVRYLDAIDVMKFDDDGRILTLRAFWNPAEMRATREA